MTLAVADQDVHRAARWRTSRDVHAHAVLDAGDVEQVAAVVGDHRVDEQHVGAEIDELPREVAADEPEAAGDEHAAAAVELPVISRHSCPGAIASAAFMCSRRMTSANHSLKTSIAGAAQAPEVEELRLAVGAVVVVHRHFGDAEPGVGDLLHHLEADDAAVLFEVDLVEDRSPHQPEVAVDVAHRQAEQELDGVVVDPADDDAVQRIGAADLVAVHQVDARRRTAARALPSPRDRTARRRRCRRPARAWPWRSRCAARRRSRGSSRGARRGPRG